MENNRQLKTYLDFLKNNEIDLNTSKSLKIIEKYFDKDLFIKKLEYLMQNKLIIKNNKDNNVLFLTKKGNELLLQLNKEIEYEDRKEHIEFEKSKIDLELSKKMLKEFNKTKIIARISIVIAVLLALKELYILIKK